MATPERPPIELLLAEAGWVRGLARGILAQPLRAEDAAQEAWLAALRRPPPRNARGNARAWLTAVARNALRKTVRAERRRSKRERSVARSEAQPSTLEVVERFSTHHAVATAVLELEEPLREAILLRYYEGLTLAAIAARTGVAVATVADRLRSGEEQLRERLRRRFGGDEGVVAALAPFVATGAAPEAAPGRPSGSGSSAVIGATGLAPSAVLGLACALLALGALVGFAWLRASGRAPAGAALEGARAVRPEPARTPAAFAALASTAAPRRVAIDPPEPVEALASAAGSASPGALRVRVRGVGSATEPVLRLRPERTDATAPALQRAAGGTALFEGLSPGLWHVEQAFGVAQRVQVRSGREETLELVLPEGRALAGTVVDGFGAPVPFADVWLLPQAAEEYRAGRLLPAIVGAEHHVTRADADGRFAVSALGAAQLVGAAAAGHAPSLGHPLSARGGACIELTLRLDGPGGALCGSVVDAAGAALPGAAVYLDAASADDVTIEGQRVSRGAPHFRVVTDAAGRFELASVRPGQRSLLVSAPAHAPWRGTVGITAGATTTLAVRLEPGASVHGSVTDEDGTPQGGVLVFGAKRRWAALPDERFAVATRTAADGSYALHGVPAEAAWLVVEGGARGRHAELLMLANGEEREVDVGLELGTPLQGVAVDEHGRPLADLIVRAWRAGDAASVASRTDAQGRFVIAACEEELYQVLVEEHGLCVHRTQLTPDANEARLVVAEAERPSATLSGVLVDPRGAPLAATAVELTDGSGTTLVRAVEARADGGFVSAPVPPGEYTIAVCADGRPRIAFEPAPGPVRVRAGARLDLGTLTSEPGVQLELDFARSDGAPLYFLTARVLSAAGATVELHHAHDAALVLPLALALPPGDYQLHVEAAGTLPLTAPLQLGAHSPQRSTLVLEPRVH